MADYTDLTLAEAATLLATYQIHPSSIQAISGGAANSSFVVESDAGRLILTVLDNHTANSARKLASLLLYLADHRLPVDSVIFTASGEPVSRTMAGTPIILKRFIPGESLVQASPADLQDVGSSLACIHRIPPPPGLTTGGRHIPRNWQTVLEGRDCRDLKSLIAVAEDIAQMREWCALKLGLCHGDLFGDNLIREEVSRRIVILDWETASIDPLLLDLGITIVAFIRGVPGARRGSRAEAIVNGYERESRLLANEREMLPKAVFYAAAMLAYHRYLRHNIIAPNPRLFDHYRELVNLAERVRGKPLNWRRG